MPEEIFFLSVEDVIQIQANTIEHEGGMPGLRDPGLLESAVTMPQQQFDGVYLHPGLIDMATAYMFHIAMNHPFCDGNKRAAVLSALVFLDVNGAQNLPDQAELEAITMQLAAGELSKEELNHWLHENVIL
ncbi:toxin Doc [bacterium BMS3Bbin11]|nr:toxin Doc [bacterium BMS3Abin11]GBE45152.1 toxin Doc [bacterium BMS3Bbin11]GMT41179.1 MAG: death-on-curing protein [bacterium]HDH16521.1 type II toxin-antitoxin system death-on-curing family toxin [Gammaproteobacteria bacterium]HDZ77703.1 type II toxin-antitoxin system death-on-curing family toxin [Gammaproteobacteria bacterium]